MTVTLYLIKPIDAYVRKNINEHRILYIKTWSHPLRQSEPSILMLHIPPVLIHQVMVASCAGPEIVLYTEHTNKAFNKEKTKALLVYSISSILTST